MFLMSLQNTEGIEKEYNSMWVVLSHYGEQGDSVPESGHPLLIRLLFNYALDWIL